METCSHKVLNVNVYRNFICNRPKLETSQMFFSGWMAKQTVVHPYNGIQLSKKRNKLLLYSTIWMNCKDIILSERANLKKWHNLGFHLDDTVVMTKVWEAENRTVVARLEEKGLNIQGEHKGSPLWWQQFSVLNTLVIWTYTQNYTQRGTKI